MRAPVRAGETGYVDANMVTKYLPSAKLGDKAKIFVCGELPVSCARPCLTPQCAGPPGQVAAVAGKKEGMKQGALGGVLNVVVVVRHASSTAATTTVMEGNRLVKRDSNLSRHRVAAEVAAVTPAVVVAAA